MVVNALKSMAIGHDLCFSVFICGRSRSSRVKRIAPQGAPSEVATDEPGSTQIWRSRVERVDGEDNRICFSCRVLIPDRLRTYDMNEPFSLAPALNVFVANK